MRSGRGFYIGLVSLFVAVSGVVVIAGIGGDSASALTMGDRRDCGYTDVIIDCGAVSQDELLQKYDSNDDGRGNSDIQAIYSHYGIKRSDIAGTTSKVKRGWLSTDGTITVDGEIVATQAQSLYRVKVDKPVSPVRINGKTYYEGDVDGGYRRGADVFVFFKNGVFYSAIQASCGNPIPAKPEKKPEYQCKSLTADKIDRNRYRFTASATASNGAKITGYTFHFGDGKSESMTSRTIDHTYVAPGSYDAQVDVLLEVGQDKTATTSENCKVTITIEEKPVKPLYACDNLQAHLITGKERAYRFTLEYTAENGATLDRVRYDFGDGTSQTLDADEATSVEHQFAQGGNYTTVATLYFNVETSGEVTEESAKCQARVTIPKPEFCPLPGKEHLPKDSPECVETPPELPKTGLDMFIGGSLGLGSISAAGYYWASSRRNLANSFFKR